MTDFTSISLTGAGHFGFGFVVGSIVMLLLIFLKKKSLFVNLYAPFLPFLLGMLAAVPYMFLDPSLCQPASIYNVFILYSLIHCSSLLDVFLGSLNLVAIVCGIIYCFIILRYILLVKHVRRYGWPKRGKS